MRGKDVKKVLRRDALPVPENLPVKTRCVQVTIPDDQEYLLHFSSILTLLGKWNSYQQDGGTKAAKVAQIWKDVLKIASCEPDNGLGGISLEEFMSQQIRLKPENSCIIQMWCIDHWEDWYNPNKCVASSIEQPTNGSDLEAGECREWDVSLRANDKWLLPVAVSTGDTINVTDVTGAWNDGTLDWWCPNGDDFTIGVCFGAGTYDAGDPLTSQRHMRLIMNVDGSFTDAYGVLYSTPPGITNGQVFFQANDGSLTDNAGTITFHVKVCRAIPEPETISLTYYYGEGDVTSFPLSLGETRLISFNALLEPDGGSNNYGIGFFSDHELNIELVSLTGFAVVCGGCTYELIWNSAHSGFVVSLNSSTSTNPFTMTMPTAGYGYQLGTGVGGAAFSGTIRVSLP